VRIIDRFFLGEPQIRGFDIRGVGPRVQRFSFTPTTPVDFNNRETLLADDALGGRAYYLARAEVEIPLSSGLRELGLRPSVFVDAGAVFGLRNPEITSLQNCNGRDAIPATPTAPEQPAIPSTTVTPGAACPTGTTAGNGFVERYVGDTAKPRLSVGFGVNWNSPFGPFRIDIAKALTKAEGDDTKLITFNVGTAF
jgi:outer membrane protein insertion porin family